MTDNEVLGAEAPGYNDTGWRNISLPHDMSIEGTFNQSHPVGVHGGFLPTASVVYRNAFYLNAAQDLFFFIDFDGVYRNSEVWINGHLLGRRPNGYISFRYDITEFVYRTPNQKNVLVVKADNFAQPGSRWYTGTGIYRNVRLTATAKTHIDHWGVVVTTSAVTNAAARLRIQTNVVTKAAEPGNVILKHTVFNGANQSVAEKSTPLVPTGPLTRSDQELIVTAPRLWSDKQPYLYTVVTQLIEKGRILHADTTKYGIRYFNFHPAKGFFLNGLSTKIKGVCNHHDLGCLGAAVNKSAIKRQLLILKSMGCNAIRTAHNPPAPELLDLCDELGFLVMDEAFDIWTVQKTPFDYHWNWPEWHKRDLEDQVKRDRNHPSVIIWSIGNEIPEQLSPRGGAIATELRSIIRALDTTRPITAGNNLPEKNNTIIQSGALDLVGVNYRTADWQHFPTYYPGAVFIGTETVSGLQTRGEYTFPSDVRYKWGDDQHPVKKPVLNNQCPAFDQATAPWGSTHEETLKEFKKYDFVSGMFVWAGFDYLGEPTPYYWPSRSSYFGIIDMAGFPKDVYYLYQSEWTDAPVLHVFPHWNWLPGQPVDVWAYYNNADEVELFVNGKSQGVKRKTGEALHVMWRVAFEPGMLTAVSRKRGQTVLRREIKTAGAPAALIMTADKASVNVDEKELVFLTVKAVDAAGNSVPTANRAISFETTRNAFIAGVDNGNPISHEPLKGIQIRTFNGLALAVVQPTKSGGTITVRATAEGLAPATVNIRAF